VTTSIKKKINIREFGQIGVFGGGHPKLLANGVIEIGIIGEIIVVNVVQQLLDHFQTPQILHLP